MHRCLRIGVVWAFLAVVLCLSSGIAVSQAASPFGGNVGVGDDPPKGLPEWLQHPVFDADGVQLMRPDPPKGPPSWLSGRALTVKSGNDEIDALLSSYKWGSSTVTYSFYSDSEFGGEYYSTETVSEVSDKVKANFRAIFAWLGSVINVDFVEVAESYPGTYGKIRIMLSSGPNYAYCYYPYSETLASTAGDIHLNPSYDRLGDTNGFQHDAGKHGYMTLIHELGHGIGLKHPHDGSPNLPYETDNTAHTVMSYNFTGPSAGTDMPFDVRALDYLYGLRPRFETDTTYAFESDIDQFRVDGELFLDSANVYKQAIWDSGGNDTLDFSALSYDASGHLMDMQSGGWLVKNVEDRGHYFDWGTALCFNATFESIIGSSSDDHIYANQAANTFGGYQPGMVSGADIIENADSDDTLDLTAFEQVQVTETRVGDDLTIDLGAGTGTVTIVGYYAGNNPSILYKSGGSYAPVADAGEDQSVNEFDRVDLDGTGSSDTDGFIVGYSWVQLAGPSVTLYNVSTATPYFYAPDVPSVGDSLEFELTVTDDEGFSDTDRVTVAVNHVHVPEPPVANAGPHQTVDEGTLVTLDGTASYDPDGFSLTYAWVQTYGPIVSLSGASTASPIFTAPQVDGDGEILTFELTVTDVDDMTDTDTITVTVEDTAAVLLAPSNLSTSVSGATVILAWSDNSDNEEEFLIERAMKVKGKYAYAQIASVGAGVTSYEDTVSESGTYRYRVRARNSSIGLTSGYSNEAEAKVTDLGGGDPGGGGLAAPSELSASASGTLVSLSWIDNSPDESGFVVERGEKIKGKISFSAVTTTAADQTGYSEIVPNAGLWVYRVKAVKNAEASGYSNEASVRVK